MKLTKLSLTVVSILGAGMSADAMAIELYVDMKTQQLFAQPGPGRIKLGSFEKVEDKTAAKALEQENKALEAKVLEEKIDDKIAKHEKAKEEAPGFSEVKLTEKGIEFESKDGNFKAAINGRMQVDSQINVSGNNTVDPAIPNVDPTKSPTTNNLADGMSIRRARLGIEGQFFKNYDYKFEYDFTRGNGSTAAGITDAFVAWTGMKNCDPEKKENVCDTEWLKPLTVKIGQFKEPIGLEEATSNRYITFIERNMMSNAFLDNPNIYKMGLGINYNQPRWGLYTAIQTETVGAGNINSTSTNSNGNGNRNNGSGDSSWSLTGRIAGMPWVGGKNEFLHVGASGSQVWVNNNFNANGNLATGGYGFNAAINTDVDRTAILNTGNLTVGPQGAATSLQADTVRKFGAETAMVYGPFSAQAEYMQADVSGNGYHGESFDGWYAYGSYFLTGESRAYKAKTNAWDRLKPNRNFDMKGGWGAWEVAAGYDFLNLTDGKINGGRASTAKVGLNWYPNSHFRVMANYIHFLNVDTQFDPHATVNPSARQQAFDNSNMDIVEFRTQVDW